MIPLDIRPRSRVVAVAALAFTLSGCGDEADPGPMQPETPTGSVTIQTTTTGESGAVDRDGYLATIGSTNRAVLANGSTTITGLAIGDATVTLGGLAGNCTAAETSAAVTVSESATATASFTVDCATNPGIPRWFAAIGGELNGTSVGTNGRIYAPSAATNGVLFALEPTGSQAWSFTADGGISGPPSVHSDGSLYLGTTSGTAYSLDADGSELWSTSLGGAFGISGAPAIASDGTQYWNIDNFLDPPALTAVSSTGASQWSYSGGGVGNFTGPVVAADGTIYVGRNDQADGAFISLDPTGAVNWTYDTEAVPTAAAIATDGTIYFGGGASFDGSSLSVDGKLYALAADGSLEWTFDTGGIIDFAPSIGADGTIYVISGSSDPDSDPDVGRLHAINADGTEAWSQPIDGCAGAGATVGADGTIYASAGGCRFGGSGIVEAFDAMGQSLWEFEVFGEFKVVRGAIPIAADGTAYVASELTGEVYALHTESMGLAASAWPKPGHDNQNSASANGGS